MYVLEFGIPVTYVCEYQREGKWTLYNNCVRKQSAAITLYTSATTKLSKSHWLDLKYELKIIILIKSLPAPIQIHHLQLGCISSKVLAYTLMVLVNAVEVVLVKVNVGKAVELELVELVVLRELVDSVLEELVDSVLRELVDSVLTELVDSVLRELVDSVLRELVGDVLIELVLTDELDVDDDSGSEVVLVSDEVVDAVSDEEDVSTEVEDSEEVSEEDSVVVGVADVVDASEVDVEDSEEDSEVEELSGTEELPDVVDRVDDGVVDNSVLPDDEEGSTEDVVDN